MKDALKNLSDEVAAALTKHIQTDGVREFITKIKSASDEDTGTFEVVITSENLDRYQEVIKLDGWNLTHYLANPVVLWGHDHNRIIGAATSIEARDGKLIAKGKFAPTAEGQEKRKLYDAGFLRATSVGFIEKEREGNLITKAELLEFSFVSVPANPYALSLAMEKSLNVNELVTKGIMFVEKSGQDEGQDTVQDDVQVPESEEVLEPVVTPETPVEEPVEAQEKNFSTKQLSPVIDSLKAAVTALEALGIKSEEPEGVEEPVVTPEERDFADFSAKRKLLQDASTMIADVLAEVRQGVEAKRKGSI